MAQGATVNHQGAMVHLREAKMSSHAQTSGVENPTTIMGSIKVAIVMKLMESIKVAIVMKFMECIKVDIAMTHVRSLKDTIIAKGDL